MYFIPSFFFTTYFMKKWWMRRLFHWSLNSTIPLIQKHLAFCLVVPSYLLFRRSTIFNWTILKCINYSHQLGCSTLGKLLSNTIYTRWIKVLRISQNRGSYMFIILSFLLREKLQQTIHKNHCLITAVLSEPYNQPWWWWTNNTCSGTPLSIVQ